MQIGKMPKYVSFNKTFIIIYNYFGQKLVI